MNIISTQMHKTRQCEIKPNTIIMIDVRTKQRKTFFFTQKSCCLVYSLPNVSNFTTYNYLIALNILAFACKSHIIQHRRGIFLFVVKQLITCMSYFRYIIKALTIRYEEESIQAFHIF